MRIGEIAERVGTTPRTIRYYEEIGLLWSDAERPAGAHRSEPGPPDAEAVTAAFAVAEPLTRPVGDPPAGAATTAVVDSKITTAGPEPAEPRFWHRRRRS